MEAAGGTIEDVSGCGRAVLGECVKVQQTATVALVYFDDTARLEESLGQMKVHTKMAVDGKEDRFKAEKYAKEWKAGAIHRARQRQLSEKWWGRVQQLPSQQRVLVQEDEEYAREMGLHIRDWLED